MGRLTTIALAIVAILAAGVAAVILTRPSDDGSKATAQPAPASGPSVRVADTKLGRILVDAKGRTLYLYVKDQGAKSACDGKCARVWPPATVAGTPTAGPGVIAAKLTTAPRADHSRQLVYNGHPLYTLTSDVRPGQISGEGFLGTWYVISAAGNRVGKLTKTSEY